MAKKLKNKTISLEKQLSNIFALLYLSAFLISFAFLLGSVINYQSNTAAIKRNEVEQLSKTLSDNISQVDGVISRIFLENDPFLRLPYEEKELEQFYLTYELANTLKLLLSTNQGIDGLFIHYNNGEEVIYRTSEQLSVSGKDLLLLNNKSLFNNINNINGSFIQKIDNAHYYTIYYIKEGIAIMGIININSVISAHENNTLNNDYMGVFDDNNVIGYKSDSLAQEFNFDALNEGQNRVNSTNIYLNKVENANLSVFGISAESVWTYINRAHLVIFVLLVFSIYPAYKLYNILKRQILSPLNDLIRVMNTIQGGDWSVKFEDKTHFEEIESVKKALVVMVQEIENLKIKAYEEESQKQYAELQYLQQQLSPHFYINCLKLIQAKIQLGHTEDIEELLVNLSMHFRYLIKKTTMLVTVKDEIEFVKNYLALAKNIVSGQINSFISCEPSSLNKHIPMLSIQTFVENSIKYARSEVGQALTLHINVRFMEVEDGNFVNITVKDSGVGYKDEFLELLNNLNDDNECLGAGISNLKKRIILTYKCNYNWYFYNDSGAVSDLLLPCEVESAN